MIRSVSRLSLAAALLLGLGGCHAAAPLNQGASGLEVLGSPSPEPGAAPSADTYVAVHLTVEEAYAKVQSGEIATIVDVRGEESYLLEHVANAINLPWSNLDQGYAQLPKDRFILLYCT